ncbi:hypothetical protein MLD38_002129 [Melastoma candidum]|uniref:Uncharacterized protein n=1 Tax=Melastoma candidum TaxID=119954 RepID=A0ACB9SFK1_9MYRT|nr:hypothetical protein MLD38_002129 [Melastoma candidum]
MKVSVKSKRERLKRLSLVGGKNSSSDAMSAVVGVNNDDGPHGNVKRLKLSKKSLNGCKVAGKTSVPRKLRTAMKKRGCEYPSPTSTIMEKPCNSTLEDRPPKQNGDKKSKKDANLNWSPRKSPCVPMTKDEKEVAEILFAMPSMFTAKETRHYSAQASKVVWSEVKECSAPALEGRRIESDMGALLMTHEVVSTSVNDGKHGEETKRVMNEDESVIQRTYMQTKHVCEESNQCEEPLPRLGREMSNDKMQISCSVGFNSGPCIGFGSQQPRETMPAFDRGTPEFTNGLASCHGSQLQCPGIFKGFAGEDSCAWPFGVTIISNERSNPQQMSISKMPAWIDATVHYRNPSSRGLNHSKASENAVGRISRKRCATHVWIGYLIQELKGEGDKGSASMIQMYKKQEMNADRELHMQASLSRLRNFSSNSVSLANHMEAKHKQTPAEVKKGIPFLETPKETQFRDLFPEIYKQDKQVFDFLSLSNGEGGFDANTLKGGTRTGLQQVGQQLPTTVGSSGPRFLQKGSRVWSKEEQQPQQLLLQQMLWAAMAYPQGPLPPPGSEILLRRAPAAIALKRLLPEREESFTDSRVVEFGDLKLHIGQM